ncbi:MAG: ROK family protein [Methanospirillum sp.]|uniref:ROK family protein n=1 Tax=Methanospirillum sp. TaxID=45200 RepID=UPI002375C0D4|nr:ROK family protein [Methanospirillum sp.]MDD1728973.1 ROK family protein [Methanospirillum sp.]
MRVAGVADIGGTNTRVALIREDKSLLAIDRFRTPAGIDPAEVTSRVGATLVRFIRSASVPELCGIGVSVAGPVDLASGSISHPPNMPFDEVPIVTPLSVAFGCPITLMNDCRAAVLGEVFAGGAKGYRHVVYITISTGIGGGVYSDGRVLMGRGGNAGEIGHFTVESQYMQPCSCGKAGHWEGCSSGGGMPGFYQTWCRVHNVSRIGTFGYTEDILAAASAGDPVVCAFIKTLAEINGRGISTVIVAYDPDIIIFDGPVVTAHQDLILYPALDHLDHYLPTPAIAISPLGGNAPLFGVAAAVFSREL